MTRLRPTWIATAAITVVLGVAATPASARTQIGETFVPDISGGSGITYLQVGSPSAQSTVPFAGTITSWSFQAAPLGPPTLVFKVARPAGGNDFTIVGEDGPRAMVAGALNTFPVSIPVQAGDVIGHYKTVGGPFLRTAASDYVVQHMVGDPALGTTPTFEPPASSNQLDLAANLEPLVTGKRAAALKKCKKIKSKKKRKKCRKKARRLPV
jgi:hypothetical protein